MAAPRKKTTAQNQAEATVTAPDLDGFALGVLAPRTIYRAFVGGFAPEFLTLSAHEVPGVGGDVVVFEGDVVDASILATLGLS